MKERVHAERALNSRDALHIESSASILRADQGAKIDGVRA